MEMTNFNNLELVELDFNEMVLVDGGRSWLTIGVEIGIGLIAGPIGVAAFELGYALHS